MEKCINCAYFLNCNNADENKKECNSFKKSNRIVKGNKEWTKEQ